jgi:hypothetical protein
MSRRSCWRRITGAIAGYGLEYWTQVIAMPLNIGGRPFHSWVSFIPPAFETTILFAAFSAVLGMLALNGLPQPYHPVFNVERSQAGELGESSSWRSKPRTRSSTRTRRRSSSPSIKRTQVVDIEN